MSEPEEDDIPEPTPPPAEDEPPPEEGPPEDEPPPEEDEESVGAEIEPYLAFDEFVAIMPGLRDMSQPRAKATEAALRSWMRRQGYAASGHFPRAQWQEYFEQAMAAT